MKPTTIKVVIPMAGLGTRLRPHTWSKPKQLVSVAGKTVLDHLIDTFATLPPSLEIELIAIVGYLGDQIEEHIRFNYPDLKSYFVVQENPVGQSHAIKLAEQYLSGPMLVVFADTLIETDLSILENETAEAVTWYRVPDLPLRRPSWGERLVKRLIEKPQAMETTSQWLFLYFKEAKELLRSDEQIKRDMQLEGEFFLADAVNIMLERGLRMRIQEVDVWLDAGTAETLLATNRYLLEHGMDNTAETLHREGVVINPPVFIHPTAQVHGSIIGPNVSLGAGCQIEHSIIRDSILEDEAQATDIILDSSLVGRRAVLRGRPARSAPGREVTL
jgi:glucose-1-phosphate thymidylyltransferase